ncbi:hypothetical protein Pmani_017518 [Petrolisthes manimaculis]|uniref:Uncharacterized protein n=1 Tax=Petrolisthes manimaculis TaxID=1843537 RepID=A0AAE1PPL3_9EUCA|nr:hypothetical protein Pmani_017518 [Petrolisthes manimaculis]
MAKPISNPEKWSRDDFRLLVVLLLTIVYPLFVSSFYALYVFTMLPGWVASYSTILQVHDDGWYHYYWLVAALFWIFLCAVILPCFWDQRSRTQQLLALNEVGGPSYQANAETVQPPIIHVEESVSNKRVSVLSIKSRKSSDLSITKEIYQEEAEKKSLEKSRESLEKSRESLEKSYTSLERTNLTQSGDFLNEFIDSIQSEKLNTKEAECEVHVEEKENPEKNNSLDPEKEKEDGKQDFSDNQSLESSDSNEEANEPFIVPKKNVAKVENSKQDTSDSQSTDSSDSNEEANEPFIVPKENETKLQEATQEKIEETEALTEKPETLDEMDKPPEMRKKARPTIDVSQTADECYECSMPTPSSAEPKRPESNMVFLFVNPESAAAKENVIIEHEGDVTEATSDKDEKDIDN